MELGPSSLLPVSTCPEVQQVSMFGCGPDMCRTVFEFLGCGVLKYTGKGSREFTCVSFENAVKMMDLICKKQGTPTPVAKAGNPLLKVLASFLRERLDKSGLAHLDDLPGLVAQGHVRLAVLFAIRMHLQRAHPQRRHGTRLWKALVPWRCCGRWFRKASSRTDRSMRSSV